MKKRERQPTIPRTAGETARRAIMALLLEGPISAREISAAVGFAEKEVAGHLEHLRRSLHTTGAAFAVTPAECRHCGFVFAGRERLTSPGRCPVCRHEAISDPLFSIRGLEEQETE